MAVEVRKKGTESNENLIRRFTRRVQTSGTLLQVKKRQFHTRGKSRDQLRREAIRREKIRQEIAFLRKIGKLPEETEYPMRISTKDILRPKIKKT